MSRMRITSARTSTHTQIHAHTHWYCMHTQLAISTAVSALDEAVFRTQLSCFTFLSLPFSCLLIILHLSLSLSHTHTHTHTHCRCSLNISQMKISQIYSHTLGFQLQMQLRQRKGVCVCEFLKMSSQLPEGENLYLREVTFVRGEKIGLVFFSWTFGPDRVPSASH